MIQVYTGDGKGKTTAALGLALRAIGAGKKVLIIQFMKGDVSYGEILAAKRLYPDLIIIQSGRNSFVDRKSPAREDIIMAEEGYAKAKEAILSRKYDIVILDEINVAMDYHLLDITEVADLLKNCPDNVEVILTGRNAPQVIVEIADLVTEMVEKKHYYKKAVKARRGIEF